MARPLRIEYPGACYHVVNRGNQRATVFHQPRFYQLFIDKLGEFALVYGVEVYAYCCMPNHFHLFIQTREANLSRFMQGLLTSFTIVSNRWRSSSGHLFQGRYKAQLVESELYRSKLSRYIHLNPVRVQRLKEFGEDEKRRYLHGYKWSSYRVYVGKTECPSWLESGLILGHWGSEEEEQRLNYARYVEQGLTEEVENPFMEVVNQTVLGSAPFVERIKKEQLLDRESNDRREEVILKRFQGSFEVAEVIEAVAIVYGQPQSALLKRKSKHREARRVLLYCVSRYCRGQRNLTALAGILGVSVSALTNGRRRVEKERDQERSINEKLVKIEGELKRSLPAKERAIRSFLPAI